MATETGDGLTVSGWLNGGLNVADALDSNAVLVVLVDVRVLQLAHLVKKDAQLVCNIGNIIVASLTPNGKLLLESYQYSFGCKCDALMLTATSMRSLPTSSMLLITFFSIFTSCASFLLSSVLPKPALYPCQLHPYSVTGMKTYACFLRPWPNPPLPKRRPDLVEDGGGGGFWSCDAVGARDCLKE